MEQNLQPEPEFAALLALDWADREHAWALQIPGRSQREQGKLEHTPEAIEAWATQLAVRFPGQLVAVAVEQSRGALFYALRKYAHLVLYSVPPSLSSAYRKAMFPSGRKSDPVDANVVLDLLVLHRDRLRALPPDTEATRQLQALVEQRRQLVDERTAQTNRITNQLKLYFPQILDWFDNLACPMVAAFLQRWPTLDQLQAAEPEQLRAFFHAHRSRSTARIEARLRDISRAQPLLTDPAVIQPAVLMVATLLALVAVLNTGIREMEKVIQQVAAAHPDYPLFASFPAAGPALAPRLLAAFGSCRERFCSAEELQSFSGIAPITVASGSQKWIHFRWACPKFLRQTFHEYAARSIPHCPWAKAFYRKQGQPSPCGRALAGLQVGPHSVPLLALSPALPGTFIHRRPTASPLSAQRDHQPTCLWESSDICVEIRWRDFEISSRSGLTDYLRFTK